MANVYAVKTGNWSDPTVWNTGSLPTSADDVFSNNFTVTIDQNVNVLSIRNTAQSPAVAGGGYSITGNFTITAPNLIKSTPVLITYSGTGTMNINASVVNQSEQGNSYLNITSNGNVNWVGNITNFIAQNARYAIAKQGTGKLTFTGDISTTTISNAQVILITAGDFEMTGNITIASASFNFASAGVFSQSTGSCIITGTLRNNSTATGGSFGNMTSCVYLTSAGYLKHIGSMINNSVSGVCLDARNAGTINILTGPFISSPSGILPLLVSRMHYQVTLGSYYEFRDSSTNGALPPAAPAPAIRMNSPEVGSDLPTVNNVRFGTVYGASVFTGTMRVPAASNVRLGVAVDNTTGTGAITAADVWNALTSGMNTSGSIGARLKNASTVDTTGNQLAALL